ncbi:calcium-activated chloride channel regulator 1-like, partial [Saccoglossus kowalevskii]
MVYGVKIVRKVENIPNYYHVIPVTEDPVPFGEFGRVTSGGSFQVDSGVYIPGDDEDLIPPERITDMESPVSNYEEQTITLVWTSVGDDLDQGTASYYEIRYSTSFDEVLDNFEEANLLTNDDLIQGNISSPLPSGSTETYIVLMPTKGTGTTYYFAVRAIDDVGNQGELSNIAQNTIVPIPDEGLAGWEIFLIVIGCLLGVAMILIVVFLIYYYIDKERKSKPTSDDDQQPEHKYVTKASSDDGQRLENKYAVNPSSDAE